MALLQDPSRTAEAPGRTARARGEGRPAYRWERVADAAFYGLAAAAVVFVVAWELNGTALPAGTARGVLLAACVLVTLVVAGVVVLRR